MISSILSLQTKPDLVNECVATLRSMLPDTRAFKGNTGVTLYQNAESLLTLVTDWQSKQDYDSYLQWREEQGDTVKLKNYLTQAPDVYIYEKNQLLINIA